MQCCIHCAAESPASLGGGAAAACTCSGRRNMFGSCQAPFSPTMDEGGSGCGCPTTKAWWCGAPAAPPCEWEEEEEDSGTMEPLGFFSPLLVAGVGSRPAESLVTLYVVGRAGLGRLLVLADALRLRKSSAA